MRQACSNGTMHPNSLKDTNGTKDTLYKLGNTDCTKYTNIQNTKDTNRQNLIIITQIIMVLRC